MSRISNSFTVANAIVDLDLRNMSGNALKCYVVIVRKTTGWNKTSDRISISQFQEFAGIAKRDTVGKALRELEEMGLIIRHEKIGKITEYSLNFDEPTHPEKRGDPDERGNPDKRGMTHPEKRGDTHPDKQGTTKDTMTKDTFNKDTSLSGGDAHAREDAPNDESTPPCPADKPASEAMPVEAKVKRMSVLAAFTAFLVQRGVDQQVARDWWQYRDGKPMTETAWQRHCQQAAKAGITPQEAAAYAAGREWRGFYAEGYLRDVEQNFGGRYAENQRGNRKLTPHEQFLEAERQWLRDGAAIGTNPIMYGGCDDEWQDGQFREV